MARITRFPHDGEEIRLIFESEIEDHDNCFTVIVGKNGIGKSRLLAEIAKYITKASSAGVFYDDRLKTTYQVGGAFYLKSNIIAVSTSPFDKFPSSRRRAADEEKNNYKYIGIKGDGLYPSSSSIALISSAATGLLEKLIRGSNNENLLQVFNTLGFNPKIDLIMKPSYIGKESVEYSSKFPDDSSLRIDLLCFERDYGIFIDERYQDALKVLPLPKRHKVLHAIRIVNNALHVRKAVELTIDFRDSSSSLEGFSTDREYIESLLVLMKFGFMRLMDLRLNKISHGELSLRRASSGEQCLLVIMLGIAGYINHESIILIDEPEISLHPSWQEEFMLLLTSAFSAYHGCHFIIATHSPQLISRLKKNGCFITSLSQRQTYRSEDFLKKSADFQLAELFDAPGAMNEYISRLAFNLLAKAKSKKELNQELTNELEHLKSLSRKISDNDPVKELIDSVTEVCEHYANNKKTN